MFTVFYYILMLFLLLGGGWAYRGNWSYMGHGIIVWLLFLIIGLKYFPFHG